MKINRTLMIGMVIFWSILILIFAKYPFYPEYSSVDASQHLDLSVNLAHGKFPDFKSTLLYYGVEYYLAMSILICHCEPIIAVRYAMGLLVALSPLAVFFSSREIFQETTKAMVTSFLYMGSGLWDTMVFNAGLYANFFGIMAMLILAWATPYFIRNKLSVKTSVFLVAALILTIFSHFSVLIIFAALAIFLAHSFIVQKAYRKNILMAYMILFSPLAVGVVVYRSVLNNLLNFVNPSGTVAYYPPTYFSAIAQPPVLSYLFAEVGYDWVPIIALLLLSLYSFRIRNPNSSLVPSWLLITLSFSPFNQAAWRFALIALFPLYLGAVSGISKLWEKKKDRLTKHRYRPNRAVLAPILLLLLIPNIFGIVGDAATDTAPTADYQHQTHAAIQWMKEAKGRYVSVTDWHFTIANYEVGADVAFNASYSAAPNLALFYAARNHVDYLILTNITSYYQLPCERSLLTLSIKNYTSNSAVYNIQYFSDVRQDAVVSVWVNGTQRGNGLLANGSLTSRINFAKNGTFDIYAQLGFVKSNTERFFAGTNKPPKSIELPSDYCAPFYWTSDDLGGAKMTWHSKNIRIFRVSKEPVIVSEPSSGWHLNDTSLKGNTFSFSIYIHTPNNTSVPPPNIRTSIDGLSPGTVISAQGLGSLEPLYCEPSFSCFKGYANFLPQELCIIGKAYSVKVEISYSQTFQNANQIKATVVCS